jgi:hypothetical protein
MPSTVSSCAGFLDDMQLEDPLMEGRVLKTIVFAHRINQEAVGLMERVLEQLALDRLEVATKAVIGLLANPTDLASYNRGRPAILEFECLKPGNSFITRIMQNDRHCVHASRFILIRRCIAQSNGELLICRCGVQFGVHITYENIERRLSTVETNTGLPEGCPTVSKWYAP